MKARRSREDKNSHSALRMYYCSGYALTVQSPQPKPIVARPVLATCIIDKACILHLFVRKLAALVLGICRAFGPIGVVFSCAW